MAQCSAPLEAPLQYGPDYYANGCGPVPYERPDHWLHFFGRVAEELIRAIHPLKVLDAGCAMGFLVEAFWDRGVSCDGIDISEYAISQVRRDVQPYCHSRSLVEPVTDQYDLITCIEVLEHMQDFDARVAIGNLCKASDVILFSSSPNDFSEPTHVNVRPPAYWLAQFAENGFYPDAFFDASFLTPHAMLLRRSTPDQVAYQKLFADYIRARSGLQSQAEIIAGLNPSRQDAIEEQRSIAVQRTEELNARVRDLNARLVEAQEALDSDRAISDRIVARLQAEASAAVTERRELINHRDALVQVERSRI